MPELILHIGMPKTGTTALQHFLCRNAGRLSEQGVIYRDYRGVDNSHNFLARVAHRGDWGTADKFFASLISENCQKVIVSSGPLFAFSTMKAKRHLDNDLIDKFHENETSAIQGLIKTARKYYEHIKVIAYLRRQDKVLESSYNQSVKNGTWRGKGIEEFSEYIRNRLEYDRIADYWANAVGKDNLVLRIYDRQQLLNNDIRADFLAQTGITDDGLSYVTNGTAAEKNLRLSRDAFEYKSILNRIPMPRWRQHQYKRALRQVDVEMGADPVKWQDFLDNPARKSLLAELGNSNRRLAHEYFNLDSDSPFVTDDLNNLSQTTGYPGLSTETAIEIYIRINRLMRSTPYRLETSFNRSRQWIHSHAQYLRIFSMPFRWLFRKSG